MSDYNQDDTNAGVAASRSSNERLPPRQILWKHLFDEHGLTLLQSEIDEVINLAVAAHEPAPAAAQVGKVNAEYVRRYVGNPGVQEEIIAAIERLTRCLATANDNHEKFERLYYLERQKNEDRATHEPVAAPAGKELSSDQRRRAVALEEQISFGSVYDAAAEIIWSRDEIERLTRERERDAACCAARVAELQQENERLQRRVDDQDQQMHQLGVCQTCVEREATVAPAGKELPGEISREIERKLIAAVHEADAAFETAGATGSKTWVQQFLLRRLEAHGLGVGLKDHIATRSALEPSECRGCDELIGERDRAQDALQETHIALGGDGEWSGKLPPQPAPDSGDLHLDVPELARERMAELDRLRSAPPPAGEHLLREVCDCYFLHRSEGMLEIMRRIDRHLGEPERAVIQQLTPDERTLRDCLADLVDLIEGDDENTPGTDLYRLLTEAREHLRKPVSRTADLIEWVSGLVEALDMAGITRAKGEEHIDSDYLAELTARLTRSAPPPGPVPVGLPALFTDIRHLLGRAIECFDEDEEERKDLVEMLSKLSAVRKSNSGRGIRCTLTLCLRSAWPHWKRKCGCCCDLIPTSAIGSKCLTAGTR